VLCLILLPREDFDELRSIFDHSAYLFALDLH
jgi:hypothetical protein